MTKIDNVNIDEFQWFEQKKKDNKSSLGYGARFDTFFKNTKVNDVGDNAVSCHWKVPWWMSIKPQYMAAMKKFRDYHTVPNIIEGEEYYDDGHEAYRDYVENAGPKYTDRKKKRVKIKPKRKICSCKKK